MPQYHDVRTDHGDCSPLGRILGQLPVDVRTPASKADYERLVMILFSIRSDVFGVLQTLRHVKHP